MQYNLKTFKVFASLVMFFFLVWAIKPLLSPVPYVPGDLLSSNVLSSNV
jgi:hypothetical protein